MSTIDSNLKHLLEVIKDHAQLLYFIIDKRVEDVANEIKDLQNVTEATDRNVISGIRAAKKEMNANI